MAERDIHVDKNGKPADKSYLEKNLPASVEKAIRDFEQGERENSNLLDCLWGELYGAINANLYENRITDEQAKYLRSKYLFGDDDDEEI